MIGIVIQTFHDSEKLHRAIKEYPAAYFVGYQYTQRDGEYLRRIAAKHKRVLQMGMMENLPKGPFRALSNYIYAFAYSGCGTLIVGVKPPQNVLDVCKYLNLEIKVIE